MIDSAGTTLICATPMSLTANRPGCRHPVSTDAQILQNSMIQDATQEAQLANENMLDLQPTLFVAEEMGEGLGSGQVLFRHVQKET